MAPSAAGFIGRLGRTFRALRTRNYRFFFLGQTVSMPGTWMQRVAQDWLVVELGGGPLELSIAIALQFTPMLVLGMWSGLLVDRLNLRWVVASSQLAMGGLALALGLFVVSGNATLWVVYLIALALGCVTTVDTPARQAFITQMVEPDDVANAVALNSSVNQAARLVGPAVAGVLIGVSGTGPAFLVNSASFVGTVCALVVMNGDTLLPRARAPRARGQVIEGIREAWAVSAVRTPLIAVFLVSTFTKNFRVTLPLFAALIVGGGASGYGMLTSAMGAGALGGALVSAYVARPSQRLAAWGALALGIMTMLAAAAPSFEWLLVVMVGVGAGATWFNATANSLLLVVASEEMRGRVAALRTMSAKGVKPAGALLVGWLCTVLGVRVGLGLGGVIAVVAAVVLLRYRPVGSEEPAVGLEPGGPVAT